MEHLNAADFVLLDYKQQVEWTGFEPQVDWTGFVKQLLLSGFEHSSISLVHCGCSMDHHYPITTKNQYAIILVRLNIIREDHFTYKTLPWSSSFALRR